MMKQKLSVIQVVPGIGTEASGPSYSVPGLCRGLVSNDVDVLLFVSGKVPVAIDGCHIHAFKSHVIPIVDRGVSYAFYRELFKAADGAQVIHSNGLWSMYNVYPGMVINKFRRQNRRLPKFVVSPRGTFAAWSLANGRFMKKVLGALLQYPAIRNTDMFHATSDKEYEEIRAQGYRQSVAIVPIGMDLPEVDINAEAQRRRGAESLRKILFFGRLHKVKGVDRLVRAWEKVVKDGWELVIAGPDCGMLEVLKGIVAEGHVPRVSFVGEINGPAKYEFLAGGDIYVLPSDTENFGVTVTEALVSGTPVIASQGTPWQGLERERCGKWVPIGVEPLAAALKEMMAMSDEERAAMGARGREWIRRDFSWKGIGAKMKAAYEWLLAPEKVERPEWVVSD